MRDAEVPYNFINPPHYRQHPSGVECITIIQHFPYNIGNAIKYLWRVGLKPNTDSVEDLRKSINYIEFEIKRLEDIRCERTRLSKTNQE